MPKDPSEMAPDELRVAVALRVTNFLRQAIELNRNLYHGGMVPNFTSLCEVLTMPIEELRTQVNAWPELNPAYPIVCGSDGLLRVQR